MQSIWAEQALLPEGWTRGVAIAIGDDGRIASVAANVPPVGIRVGVVLPAPVNLHSHAFQRAIAGMTERRGPAGRDSFWTWRRQMYRFLQVLRPEDIEAIATLVQMEMLEAGYAGVAEFHYVHHQADGTPYADLGELSARIVAAAAQTGIGLTLLPVLYQRAGCDDAPLAGGQLRFGNSIDQFARLIERDRALVAGLAPDATLGVAPHSLRAVSYDGLAACAAMLPQAPLHMHIAEQTGEVDEVVSAYGGRPVAWLLANHEVDARWCLVHATQMTAGETASLARSGAVAGLCPITESNLGDGIFNGAKFLAAGGRFGVGSDSNVRIALAEELRTLEYSQRLRDRARSVLASAQASTGRTLFGAAAVGGAQAAGRASGAIVAGRWADLLALNTDNETLDGKIGDDLLDSYIFAGDDSLVADLWSAGRHLVQNGRHAQHASIVSRYRDTMRALGERL